MDKYEPQKHLLVIENKEQQSTVHLESATCSIGRDSDNLIVLNSPKISRYHATLLRITIPGTDGHQFRIIDGDLSGRRSRNGIKVNGERCFSYDLQDGDIVGFCDGISATYFSVSVSKSAKDVETFTYFEEEEDDENATRFIGDPDVSLKSRSRKTLNMSSEERQASIQQSLERLASFPELFSDPIIEIDLKGNITYLNPAALKRFPLLKQDKLQHPILVGIMSSIEARDATSLVREVKIKNKVFEQSIHLISASQVVRCYVSDITKRKQAEKLLKQAHRNLEKRVKERTLELAKSNETLKSEIAERKQAELEIRLLQTITQAITEALNFDEAIAITLRKVCETIGWSYGEAWIPNLGKNVLELSPSWYTSIEKHKFFWEESQKINFPPNVAIPGRIWASQQPEWTEDISLQAEDVFLRNEIAKTVGLKTAFGVPITANKEVMAVLVFFDLIARTENKQTIDLIFSVASQLGLIIEHKRSEDALRSSTATNKAILNAIPDLIFRVSREGTFVNFKAAKADNLLTPESKFLGKHIYEVFPTEISLPTMNCIERVFATGEVQSLECQIPDEEQNKARSYEVRIALSDIDEVMAIVRDITDRKQAEEDIRRTLEQEKKLNELKSRFVTMASHEFRTPLASILSSSELLEHYSYKWSEEKKLSHLHRIQSSVKHMTELLNDVLLLGKADAGKLKLNPNKFDLFKFCQELVEEIQIATTTHQVFFHGECLTECNDSNNTSQQNCAVVCMDEKMLRHILNNLLSNAIKYSPNSDRVIFNLICQSKQSVFRIQDFGIGVPPSELDRLFDSFHRADNVGSIPGTGLGLPIVKRSIDLHGGTIIVDSKLEEGTTFTVTLPYLVSC
ncbi:FHA domain-containing protein [Pleurocapsales cyanobacterium LEGE 10410]|nr:FHA domain-containing protein [Pleurocapsales cyanobacterium LEGE 10410]